MFCPQTVQNIGGIYCAKCRKKIKIYAVLKNRQHLSGREWDLNGNNQKEVPSTGNFVTRALVSDDYKKHCRMLQWIAHLLCREILSLLYTHGAIQFSVPSIWKLPKSGNEDHRKLESVQNKSLYTEILKNNCRLYTTSQYESLHHIVSLTYAPKSKEILMDYATTFGTVKSSEL